MKQFIYLFFLLGFASIYSACNNANASDLQAFQTTPEGLNWYSIDDLDKLGNQDGKKVLIDLYTSWCGWCKVMDKKTFTDPKVVEYLNENFVLVKFDAEQKDPVVFQGETYEWIPAGRKGVNKFALKLMNGRMGYPTLVYMDSDLNKIRSSPGYKKPGQLLNELQSL